VAYAPAAAPGGGARHGRVAQCGHRAATVRTRPERVRVPVVSACVPADHSADMELQTVLRMRLGTPILSGLPAHCVCNRATDLSTDAYHLLACPTLNSRKGSQSLRVEWPANTWNERHQLVKDVISAHLASAGVCVIDEPGPLHGDLEDGAPRPRPDQLLMITFITRGEGHGYAMQVGSLHSSLYDSHLENGRGVTHRRRLLMNCCIFFMGGSPGSALQQS
jgi:hypothetical protein